MGYRNIEKNVIPCDAVIKQKNLLICGISLGELVLTKISSLWLVLDYHT